ncbi:UNVERIFIED_CONTAM: MMS19 nucleotide excision repair protein [Sesamum angustifolium]|uniref:MMS19 nucleotide excision repair protein n=1 Tax=Sesamum angustifolium TaxID=2727405 RepID=A0AAW2LJU5_9LAMI
MADSVQWIQHVELYVSSSATPSQQVASVDAVATLLKNDLLTLEALLSRLALEYSPLFGILLLGELLAQLTLKPLDSTSIHSLIGFFTERLADWKALRGAIVGCLALLRRKSDVGRVTDSESKAVAQSYLQNLQVQSLGQHDRKLSFQLMECLLDRYAGAMADLGDNLVYGICEAIDGEKDPQCLLLVFHIVEILPQLYPGPSGPLANFAEDLFEILGCYFPIHFTHTLDKFGVLINFMTYGKDGSCTLREARNTALKMIGQPKGEDDDVKREELARALMLAFASTPLFEPFSIPLLLEKLSSSLPSAKEVIRHCGEFISLIIGDKDINTFLISLNQYKGFEDIPLQVKQKLHGVGHILSSCAKASAAMCNKVFESFFPLLMDGLGLSVAQPSQNNSYLEEECFYLAKFKFGPLYLCIELIAACKNLTVSLYNCTSIHDFPHQRWCSMLSSFSESLVKAFVSMLRSNVADSEQSAYVYCGVKGLQILATFPGSFAPVSKSINDNIFFELVAIITSDSNKTVVWKSALKALVEIGFSIEKCLDSEKAASFESTVVEKIVSLISSLDSAIPLSLRLEAAFEIGATRKDFMLRVVQGLDEAIDTNFSAVFDHGNHKSNELTIKLLDTYSQKVLPWFLEIGGSEEVQLNFALSIWDKIENFRSLNLSLPEFASDLLGATMTAMKKAVGSCSEESQEIIINKASGVLFSSTVFGSMGFKSGSSILKEEGLQQTQNYVNSSGRDEWLTSLFASVVVALRPQTGIPNGKMILQLFITSLLNGHVPSAHALGSLVNKLPLETKGIESSRRLILNEALDMIFYSFVGTCRDDSTSENDGSGVNISSLRLNTSRIQSEINTVIGLAWIGKGLLMRGHEKVKDITMTLLSFLTLDCDAGVSKQFQNLVEVLDEEGVHQLMKCAGDAFHIIMSDSGECLNRLYHATVRPLYKQRFFSTIMPILLSLVVKSESSFVRSMLYRAFAHVVSDTPLTAILGEAKKLFPILLECLSTLSKDVSDKGIIYSVLLVISGILLDKNGQEAGVENASSIVNQLIELTAYPHMMAVRETAIQCLVAVSELPHARVYPLRTKVLRAISKALDDPKRIVRQEAVRCRQAWASIASRSLHF